MEPVYFCSLTTVNVPVDIVLILCAQCQEGRKSYLSLLERRIMAGKRAR